jgi:type I restriction enzyme, S subunit
MSDLNYLDRLLDGAGVEWCALGQPEVGEFIRGGGLQKKDFTETGVGCIHYGQIYTHYGAFTDKTKTFVSEDFFRKARKAKPGDLVVATTSENDEDVCKAVAWLGADEIAVSSDACIYRHKLNPKYASYFFQTEQFQKQKAQYITGTKVRRVNADDLAKIRIPIPCPDKPKKSLEIQSEIVRILDNFTELTAELTAELTTRKKQYNYYRDQLLSFEDGEVEWKTLGEIANIQRGASPRPIAQFITDAADGIPWIKIGDTSPGSKYVIGTAQKVTLAGAEKSRILNKGDFIMSNSMSFGRPYILRIRGAIHDGWASISGFGGALNSDYLYHYLSSNKVQNYWAGKINSSSVSNLNADIIQGLPVPIVDLTKQKEIALLLDKFDALTNSITEGLPREIELRQKQYEHYRDLLLSFPRPDAVVA